jgi:hypothetical protein
LELNSLGIKKSINAVITALTVILVIGTIFAFNTNDAKAYVDDELCYFLDTSYNDCIPPAL